MRQWTSREFIKVLKKNGYVYSRHNGDHYIYVNESGRHISIPQKLECVIAKRLIKEYNLNINLNKTINASVEQIAAINKLKQNGEFNKLNENLKEIAELRLENPDMSLIELGKLLKKPVGKSGVNYRLKKIIEIADD